MPAYRSDTPSATVFGRLAPACLFCLTTLFTAAAGGQESAEPDDHASPAFYETDSYEDWKSLCTDPDREVGQCHLYQLITDDRDVPVTTVRVYPVRHMEGIAALATFHTPLETYLKAGLLLGTGDEEPAHHPFSWCDRQGCYAQVHLSDDMIFTMKSNRRLTITIESIRAPGYPIELELSMAGFDHAFSAIRALYDRLWTVPPHPCRATRVRA